MVRGAGHRPKVGRDCPLLRGVLRQSLVALLVAAGFSTSAAAPKVAKTDANAPVTVVDNGNTWTLDNGIVKATITKRSGFMRSLVYRGVETMGRDGGGIWEETPSWRRN